MLNVVARYWWVLALRGLAAILFGILVLISPVSLILLFGIYAIADGILGIITGIRDRASNPRWWAMVLECVVGIIAGIIAFAYPAFTGLVFVTVIAFWAILTGVMQLIAAIELRKEIEGEFWLGLGGVASVILGILMFANPVAGAATVIWIIAGFSIAFGIFMIILAFRLRGMQGTTPNARVPA